MLTIAAVAEEETGKAWENAWDWLVATQAEPWFWPVLGGVVALLVLLVVWCKWRGRRKPVRVFNNEAGAVLVARRALTDVVRSCCEQISGDARPHVRFRTSKGKLQVEMRVNLQPGQKLSEVSQRLQERTIAALRDNLGIDRVNVSVIAVGFARGGERAAPARPSNEEDKTEKPARATGSAETASLQPPGKRETASGLQPPGSTPAAKSAGGNTGTKAPEPPGESAPKDDADEPLAQPSSEKSFGKPAFKEPVIKEKPTNEGKSPARKQPTNDPAKPA
jgi:uncharacterized alkaline shock family protein YloU